ncbi:MAG: pyruvate, phosphate dikinase [Rubinisphaera brasiliensis]|uniref:Pyruvate, phosphate dikinase n=1 Tax=Rubinisphaera brasiliensis (strain ATCC 49424 / DSM 5305 / JCM 21570 / IAM 15109 / NBRC 103401 / IFAM 1448) TaxID=756272 RepID=F0SP79_RUBBR|nr:pyruvate, phosphate dikinase [Rubinisphaera brasiliensis]ADY61182.1 pyruvate phosphate dikinase [Rubinisphaera brasiliensis DSM 5305]MBR9802493.1 pyruvate, phosphate dikinase [bacterium]
MSSGTKYVYFFGGGKSDGDASMRNLLGGKGANLAEMNNIGLPVPAGFTITTEVCTYFTDHGNQYPPELVEQVEATMKQVEETMGAEFGSTENPLLLSCRSGARESMPGMMDTVLNIGLNDQTVEVLAAKSGNPAFAWDSYRRFIQMYGDVVMEVRPEGKEEDEYEQILEKARKDAGVEFDSQLNVEQIKDVVAQFKALIKRKAGTEFPTDAKEQVWGAIGAVFKSWMNDRAIVYRRQYGIPHNWGTAVNVQAMVFGNLGDDCATGVGLTRDCSMGLPGFNGDYLINAQGEDVVAGIRTPKRIEKTLGEDMPEAYEQLCNIGKTLEQHYKDVQDIEFTVQQGKVWMLQTRNAKRTGFAAVRIAVDLVNEGLITPEQAITKKRIPADDLNQLLQPIFDPDAKQKAVDEGKHLATGINAGPGAATGIICFHAEDAEELYAKDPNVQMILVRRETSPEDLRGMRIAKGILTAFGGASSHAALVSRQMGKTCIVGCSDLEINYHDGTVTAGDKVLKTGDWISIDGFTGEVFAGQVETKPSEIIEVLITKTRKPEDAETYQRYAQLMEWVDKTRKLNVRANAEPDDAAKAVAFGAEGVGLCRTEHMFFSHLDEIREMILAENKEDRQEAINKLLPFQREDFEILFREMNGRPVTIRLLDPPLHEFLSEHHLHEQPDLAHKLADMVGAGKEFIYRRVEELKESNPMLGHRGCRLGIVYPEVTAMQARAIIEAACNVKKAGVEVHPEIMIPLVGFKTELDNQEQVVRQVAAEVLKEQNIEIDYTVGTMIEIPRAALRADQIAETAEFFSFGTNDLTQTTLGMSRDDYGGFIGYYRENDIVPNDPFQTIDQDGVGSLMKIGVDGGRGTRSDLKIGICGEHGGDPASVMFCHNLGLNYVSCSPFRIPIARLAAAQAVLEEKA